MINLLVDVAASRRLTRLIVKDEISAPLRDHSFFDSHEKFRYLINCPHCIAIYTSAGIALSSIFIPRASKPLRYLLALAEIQSSLTDLEEQRSALVEDYGPPL